MTDILYIGGVGKSHEFGGELSKNKLILKRLETEGYKVKVIDTYGSHRNPFKIAGLPYAVVRNLHTPIIFSTNYSNIRTMVKLVRMLNSKRLIIFWAIGGRLGREVESGKYSAEELAVFDRIIVESPDIAEKLTLNGVDGVEYLPNFKDGRLSQVDSKKSESLDDGLRCIFFSRVQPEKGVDIILDAAEEADKTGRKITVDFYGEIKSSYREEFMRRVNALPNVSYNGCLNFFDGSGQKTLSSYHLSLFPTFWPGEGFPGVVVDAFMSGVPVLASDWNFNSEFVTEDCGFLCRPKDNDDFKSRLFEIYDTRSSLSRYFGRCVEEGSKYDVNELLTHEYFNRILSARN